MDGGCVVRASVVRPKTPRGDGNFITPDQIGIGVFKSSDPKPREGTETWDICCPPGEMLSEVVRPKTPRGDGNYDDWVATASVDRHSG
ncbi:Uncharacterised protein [Mycobacterium tuberculosis]|nr:Uncharacterised protein [Mycobacterium tuberculosis]